MSQPHLNKPHLSDSEEPRKDDDALVDTLEGIVTGMGWLSNRELWPVLIAAVRATGGGCVGDLSATITTQAATIEQQRSEIEALLRELEIEATFRNTRSGWVNSERSKGLRSIIARTRKRLAPKPPQEPSDEV